MGWGYADTVVPCVASHLLEGIGNCVPWLPVVFTLVDSPHLMKGSRLNQKSSCFGKNFVNLMAEHVSFKNPGS